MSYPLIYRDGATACCVVISLPDHVCYEAIFFINELELYPIFLFFTDKGIRLFRRYRNKILNIRHGVYLIDYCDFR